LRRCLQLLSQTRGAITNAITTESLCVGKPASRTEARSSNQHGAATTPCQKRIASCVRPTCKLNWRGVTASRARVGKADCLRVSLHARQGLHEIAILFSLRAEDSVFYLSLRR
jgi:hypothetical protein